MEEKGKKGSFIPNYYDSRKENELEKVWVESSFFPFFVFTPLYIQSNTPIPPCNMFSLGTKVPEIRVHLLHNQTQPSPNETYIIYNRTPPPMRHTYNYHTAICEELSWEHGNICPSPMWHYVGIYKGHINYVTISDLCQHMDGISSFFWSYIVTLSNKRT